MVSEKNIQGGTGAPQSSERERAVLLACRMRTLFEEKLMADYRETFRGELGRTQAEVLEHLYEHGDARATQIGEAIHVPKQHVSVIVSRLREAGLVAVAADPSDGRTKRVCLTPAGRAYLDAHIATSNECFLGRMSRLGEKDQAELVDAMDAMVRLLERL